MVHKKKSAKTQYLYSPGAELSVVTSEKILFFGFFALAIFFSSLYIYHWYILNQ